MAVCALCISREGAGVTLPNPLTLTPNPYKVSGIPMLVGSGLYGVRSRRTRLFEDQLDRADAALGGGKKLK